MTPPVLQLSQVAAAAARCHSGRSEFSRGDLVALLVHGVMFQCGFRAEAGISMDGETRYRHDQSAMTFVMRCVTVGDHVAVHGVALEDNRLFSLNVKAADVVSAEKITIGTADPAVTTTLIQSSLRRAAAERFIQQMFEEMIQKLMPSINKEGFERATATTETQTSSTRQEEERRPRASPYGLMDPTQPYASRPMFQNPFTIGDVDLDPFAAAPGMLPPGLRLPGHPGGMIVGPDHPMFTQPFGQGPSYIPGGNGRLPPGAVPPGARFDPIVPMGPRPGSLTRPQRPTYPSNAPFR